MENTPTPQNSQIAPDNTNNNTNNTTLDAIDQAIAVNNIVTQANNIINRTTVDATKSIFEYTLKGNPYLYTIKQEFHFNDDFLNLLNEETVRTALSDENIKRIVTDAVKQPEDRNYILNNYKPLDQIAEDGCMTYEQFLILSFLISNATIASDKDLEKPYKIIDLKKAQQIVETGAKQINEKQQTLQKVGSVVGDVSTVIGIIGSALTLSRIFWTAMPAGLFYVSLAIAITFSLYTLITRLINLYRSSQMQKNSAEINRLSQLAKQMKDTFIDKVKNAQQEDINNEREQLKAQRKTIENQAVAVQQNIAHLQQVKLQQQQSLQQVQEQNRQLLEMHKQKQQQIQQIQQENDKLQAEHEQDQKIIKEQEKNQKINWQCLDNSTETGRKLKQQLNEANNKIKEQETTIKALTNNIKENAQEIGKLKTQNQNNKNQNNTSSNNKTGVSNTNQDSSDIDWSEALNNLYDENSTNNTQAVAKGVNVKNNQPQKPIIKSPTVPNNTTSTTVKKPQSAKTATKGKSNGKNKSSNSNQKSSQSKYKPPKTYKKFTGENNLASEYNKANLKPIQFTKGGLKNLKHTNNTNIGIGSGNDSD